MAGSVSQIIDSIIEENEKTLNKIVASMAVMVKWDWDNKAKEVLDAYYADGPGRYRRTGSLRSDLVFPVCVNTGSGYKAGITLLPGRMNHSPLEQFNEGGIFENFMSGAHGNIPYRTPSRRKTLNPDSVIEREIMFTSPSPQSVLDDYYDNYDAKIDEFFEIAKNMFS